jgi:hypothetical protein
MRRYCLIVGAPCRIPATLDRNPDMLVALSLAPLLLTLELARRALEPNCPSCTGKSWAAHSTQLQCDRCGWGRVKSEG